MEGWGLPACPVCTLLELGSRIGVRPWALGRTPTARLPLPLLRRGLSYTTRPPARAEPQASARHRRTPWPSVPTGLDHPLPPWPLALPQGKDPAKGPGQLGARSTPGRLRGSPCSQMASRPHAQPQPGSRPHRHGYHRGGRLRRPEERKELHCVTPKAQPLGPVASSARWAAHLPEQRQTARAHTWLSAWPGLGPPRPGCAACSRGRRVLRRPSTQSNSQGKLPGGLSWAGSSHGRRPALRVQALSRSPGGQWTGDSSTHASPSTRLSAPELRCTSTPRARGTRGRHPPGSTLKAFSVPAGVPAYTRSFSVLPTLPGPNVQEQPMSGLVLSSDDLGLVTEPGVQATERRE